MLKVLKYCITFLRFDAQFIRFFCHRKFTLTRNARRTDFRKVKKSVLCFCSKLILGKYRFFFKKCFSIKFRLNLSLNDLGVTLRNEDLWVQSKFSNFIKLFSKKRRPLTPMFTSEIPKVLLLRLVKKLKS